jgi:hypothetical protein
MDADTFNLAASIASIILAIVAVWQAVYFYTQGKNTEARVETALASIKTQVETLQSINGRTLDRLTKYATTHREDGTSQVASALSTALKELPAIFLQFKVPTQDTSSVATRREIVNCYICLWYYTATANINAALCLPLVEEFDENNGYHVFVKNTVDRSFADFNYMSTVINNLTADDISGSYYLNLYDETKQSLINFIGDTAQHFSRQSKSHGV